jgi:hypothetical protein
MQDLIERRHSWLQQRLGNTGFFLRQIEILGIGIAEPRPEARLPREPMEEAL